MVTKDKVEDIIGLAPLQEGMLFHYLKDPSGNQYVEQLRLELSGEIDVILFEKAWNVVVTNNTMLRTIFWWEKLSAPIQIILKEQPVSFQYYAGAPVASGDSVEKIIGEDKELGFDLTTVPFRITLLKVGGAKFILLMTNHHILYDGWSTAIILKEFFQAYDDLSFNRAASLPKKESYKSFLTTLGGVNREKHKVYWEQYLQGFESVTHLPFKKQKKKSAASFQQHTLKLPVETKSRVKSFLAQEATTLASLMYTIWGLVIAKCTNSQDVVFGVTVSGRKLPIRQIESMVGLFINTVPLRLRFTQEQAIRDTMRQVMDTTTNWMEYENTPLVDIKEYSGVGHEQELFTSIVVVENYPLDKQMANGGLIKVDGYTMEERTNYELTLTVYDHDELAIEWKYNETIIEKKDVERISNYFFQVLHQIISADVNFCGEIDILSSTERYQLLTSFNTPPLIYPAEDTIISLFQKQVFLSADTIAIEKDGVAITYAALDKASNQLAAYLRSRYLLHADDRIGVQLQRSEWLLITLLAVLKSGAAYVPVDPAYPQERIDYMVSDSNCLLVIDQVELERFRLRQHQFSDEDIAISIQAHDLAYIIYTSGSTGKPKGVMIEHSSLTAFLHWCKEEFAESDFDIVYAATSICFDLSVYELFFPLTIGKKIKLLSTALDIPKQLSTTEKILLNTVPGVVGELLEQQIDLSNVTVLNMAGEPVPAGYVEELPTADMEIRNLYGPTEDTTYSTVWHMRAGEQVCIGKPKANTEIFIVH